MSKKETSMVVVFGVLAIIQTSVAPHFVFLNSAWFEWINLIDASVAIIALFERRRHNFSWLAAFWGGILLDLYSQMFFGFWIIMLMSLVALIKFAVKKYVRIPSYW